MRLRILQVLLVALPLVCRPGSAAYDGPKQWLMACGAAALLGGRAVALWRGVGWSLPSRLIRLGTGLFLLAGVVSLVGAEIRGPVFQSLWLMGLWLFVFWETAAEASRPDSRTGLLGALLGGGAAVCLIGLAQGLGWLPAADPTTGLPTIVSTLGNRNAVAGLAAVLCLPSVGLAWARRGAWRLAATATAVLFAATTIGLDAAGPRLALLGAAVVWVLGRRLGPLGASRALAALTLATVLGWGVAAVTLHGRLLDVAVSPDPSPATEPNTSIRERLLDWRIALTTGLDHPLTGVGLGRYGAAWFAQREAISRSPDGTAFAFHAPRATRAHNDPLQWWSETGAAGLLMALAGLVLLTRRLRAGSPEAAGLFAVLILSLVSFPLHRPVTALAALVLLGLGSARTDARSVKPIGPRLRRTRALVLASLAVGLAWFATNLQRAERLFDAAHRSLGADQVAHAAELLTEARALTPWPGKIPFLQGLTAVQLGRTEDGESSLEASQLLEPSFRGLLLLGETAQTSGRLDLARSRLDRLLLLHPDSRTHHDALLLLGQVAVARGDRAAARSHWEAILAADVGYHRALVGLGYLAHLEGDVAQAIAHYSHALRLIDQKIDRAQRTEERRRTASLENDRTLVVRALSALGPSDE